MESSCKTISRYCTQEDKASHTGQEQNVNANSRMTSYVRDFELLSGRDRLERVVGIGANFPDPEQTYLNDYIVEVFDINEFQ